MTDRNLRRELDRIRELLAAQDQAMHGAAALLVEHPELVCAIEPELLAQFDAAFETADTVPARALVHARRG